MAESGSTHLTAAPKSPLKSPLITQINALTRKRGVIKGRLSNLQKYVESFQQPLEANKILEFKLRIDSATSLLSEFNDLQSQIEESCDNLDEHLEYREQFEQRYFNVVARAKSLLSEDSKTPKSSNNSDPLQLVKLPTIQLPTFDGSYENWLEFRDTFLSLVHNSTQISPIQKFHYLKSALKGSAELVIDSLELSANNYSVAWELLTNRFNNSRLLIHNHVKALFSTQALTKESPVLLRKLVDTMLKHLRALKTLGEPTDFWDTLIIYMITWKADPVTEREWEEYVLAQMVKCPADAKLKLKVEDLIRFIGRRADMLDKLLGTHSKFTHDKKHTNATTSKVHCNASSSDTTKPLSHKTQYKPCPMCKEKHPLFSCQKFLDLSIADKHNFVTQNKLCSNCLRSGHKASDCPLGPCRKCCKKHNTLLHSNESEDNTQNQPLSLVTVGQISQPALESHTHNANCDGNPTTQGPVAKPVLLSTVLIEIADIRNNYHTARALLDNGSTRCFITDALCNKLHSQKIQSTYNITGVGNSVSQCTQTCNVTIRSLVGSYTTHIHCLILPSITTQLPAVSLSENGFNVPVNIQLADPYFFESQDIDMLIGADHFWDLLENGRFRLKNGPYLQNTKLGWIISGPLNTLAHSHHVSCNVTSSLDEQLRKFWELEEIGRSTDVRSNEEQVCEDHFIKTTTRDADGRFCVSMPLKESPDALGDSFLQAERRFYALEKRLQRTPAYKELYMQFIHEYIAMGHMSRIHTYNTPYYVLPHHGVFREHSTTTKLRVVFDASAKTTTGKSLNDIQCVGPAIQGDLFAILLRFRQHRWVGCADVEKMFRQVLKDPSQRNLLLILWRDNPTDPLEIYRLNTVTYGTASAPFTSVRCLKQLALECSDPSIRTVIQDDFFVDDLVTGADSIESVKHIANETTKVLQGGCFPLRKWIFNFDHDPQEFPSHSKELSLGENAHHKTLGLGWYNQSDTLHFHTEYTNDSRQLTKRIILSEVSKIFDPLGLLSPYVMTAKVLLQRLWLLKLDWDDMLPSDVTRSWAQFVNGIALLSKLRIPRHAIGIDATRVELHLFTDASQTAYGACAYIRSITDNGIVTTKLLCAKGKVAPLKPVSIPRLELCGALLGAQLHDKITKSLRCTFDSVTFWTDSTIVIGWLRMNPNSLKPFVQNRVAELHELTKGTPWNHVSGKENPADLVSRGVTLDVLSSCTLWWEGPSFLSDPSFNIPDHNSSDHIDYTTLDLPEIRSQTHTHQTSDTDSWFPFHRFTRFNHMRRVCAYMLRFVYNARDKAAKRTGSLNVTELNEALTTLTKASQSQSFPDILDSLIKNKPLYHSHNLIKLNPFIDKQNLIRVGGRLCNSPEFSYSKKHPILLSSKHTFTRLLFSAEHERLLHAAPQALLYTLRETWWPVGGRNLAKQVVHSCVRCARFRARPIAPIMGNLPAQRLSPGFPFMTTGVDYAGPVLILNRKGRGARTVKAYICIFICFTTRAVNLELVGDLSTDAYLLALKRFVSRRGKPSHIFSDNGKNFVGLMNLFSKFLSKCSQNIIDYATSQDIKFSFIPPYAPHFGGLWEAGVKSCKHHLRRVVGNLHLTYEEFNTVLTQVEAVLNSRPLSPMSTDPHDYQPLCPAHFLVGRPLTAPVCEDLTDNSPHSLSRYQRVEQIRQHFWSRWSTEYISEMQTRTKWKSRQADLKPDTLVLIKDDHAPPLKWCLGRIINTVPGSDGVARVADIQTEKGIIRRAFSKICPLWENDAE